MLLSFAIILTLSAKLKSNLFLKQAWQGFIDTIFKLMDVIVFAS